jgi:endonuclease/exonuclease/phosphatase family metal-dependent hydrolase
MDDFVTGDATSARVGAWNIEHLGSPNSRKSVGHGVAQDLAKVAQAIDEAGVSILALEEMYADERSEEGTWTSQELDELVGHLNSRLPEGTAFGWDYLLFDNAHSNDTSQVCGVLWDWNRIHQVTWWPVPVAGGTRDGRTMWDRRPHAAKFSFAPGKTDIVVIPLHMKAGSGFKAHRGEEAGQVVAVIDEVQATLEDSDILLIGDANCGAPSEQAIVAFEQAGFVELNGGSIPTVPWGNPLDRAFAANASPENDEFQRDFNVFDGDDMTPALSVDDFRMWCSDHFMIYTTVTITADDDP